MIIKRTLGHAKEFKSSDSHFYIPLRIKYAERFLSADFLLDTGATKCSVPLIANQEIFRLLAAGTDKNIQIAGAQTTYDYIVLERLEIPNTKLSVEKVDTWLADDFILGMNFLSKFSFKIIKGNKLIIEK